MKPLWLGVDAGGTKTHAVIIGADDDIEAEAVAGPGNPLAVGDDVALTSMRTAVIGALRGREPGAAHFGVAGAGRPSDYGRVQRLVARLGLHCPVTVSDDARIAFLANADPPGAILVAGTGAMAVAYDAAGESRRAGGHGYLLGDEGSGYWIGVRAVRAALRAVDGRGPATALVDLVLRFFRVESLDDVVSGTYSASVDRSTLAALAPEVVSLDDDVARAIANQAVDELMTALIAVRRHCATGAGGFPVVLAGSLLDRGGALRPLLTRRLGEALSGARDVPAANPPAAGAARLAREAGASPH
ncbi:MAG: N-acetylglucosamine kinase [Actinomycetota bacterium]